MRALLLCLLVASTAAWGAQKKKKVNDDAPVPYDDQTATDDDDDKRRDLPKRSDESRDVAMETEVEREDREISLAGEDDPNLGIGAEIVLGANLLDSARASGVEPLFMGGIRITWEWSRIPLIRDEFWREVFFADLTWFGSSKWGPSGFSGTTDIYDSVNYHHFTIAEGFALPLGKTPFAFFGQVGLGFSYQTSSLYVQGQDPTSISATRFVFQYGAGIRARIRFVSDEDFRAKGYQAIPCLSFRIETTRFRRAYMDDTFIGGSAGITF